MTREPRLNYRLENEYRALVGLREAGVGEPGLAPEPAFFGHHGGLAILGLKAIAGVPMGPVLLREELRRVDLGPEQIP